MDSVDTEQNKLGMAKEIEHASFSDELSFSPEEEKALVRKVDLTLLPTIWIMYLLSYLDRTKYVDCDAWPLRKCADGCVQHWKCEDLRYGGRLELDVQPILHCSRRVFRGLCRL